MPSLFGSLEIRAEEKFGHSVRALCLSRAAFGGWSRSPAAAGFEDQRPFRDLLSTSPGTNRHLSSAQDVPACGGDTPPEENLRQTEACTFIWGDVLILSPPAPNTQPAKGEAVLSTSIWPSISDHIAPNERVRVFRRNFNRHIILSPLPIKFCMVVIIWIFPVSLLTQITGYEIFRRLN